MNQSISIASLAAALVEAQKEFAPAIKAKANPAFRGSLYVDLASAIDAAQPALLKHGIAVLQGASGDVAQQSITITTRVLHSSGEWIEDSLTLPAVNRGDFTAQSAGSAITYARRYSYMAILGFAPEDDDGNAASAPGKIDAQPKAAKLKLITALQAEEFRQTLIHHQKKRGELETLFKSLGITTSGSIPATKFNECMEWARGEGDMPTAVPA